MKQLAKILGTGFGTGLAPIGSGTLGSLLAVAVYYYFAEYQHQLLLWQWLLILVGVFFPIGIWSSGELEDLYGHDPRQATIDELVGQWIAFLFLPFSWSTLILGFVFFRLYDITKPEPINRIQKLPKGFGIMMDDVLAGIYANISVWICLIGYDKIKIILS
ncbi:MAG: phosphatidylglycerophosphatase A [Chloroherpetonaceae bacterium]|nr:phosphatidylglycerophosphatase A [Chloroherpetonaceae bacterium]